MAVALSTQLERLERERERLEELLMLDANWRALRQLEGSEAAGDPLPGLESQAPKDALLKALTSNRIFAARAKLIETIDLLASDRPAEAAMPLPDTLASRIVLLSEPLGEQFRARLRMKPAATAPALPEDRLALEVPAVSQHRQAAMPDALELIEGLSRQAVEQLLDGGVTRFAEITSWTSVDVAEWRARLDGLAQGQPGCWIEQAAVLATGRLTRFAARARRGEYASLVPAPGAELKPAPAPPRSGLPARQASLAEPSRSGPVLPEAREMPGLTASAAPAPLPPAAHTRLTAEDLARALAASAVSQPPALAASQPEAQPAGSRQAFARAARPLVPPADHSDVRVVIRDRTTTEPAVATAGGSERPRRLLQRLKSLQATERFEAASYAAYRDRIEEATVTILPSPNEAGSAAPAGSEPDQPVADHSSNVGPGTARPERPDTPARASRFLRALTGKA